MVEGLAVVFRFSLWPVAYGLWPMTFSIPPCPRSSLSVLSGKVLFLILVFFFVLLRVTPCFRVGACHRGVSRRMVGVDLAVGFVFLFPVPYSLAFSNNHRPAASLYDVWPD